MVKLLSLDDKKTLNLKVPNIEKKCGYVISFWDIL